MQHRISDADGSNDATLFDPREEEEDEEDGNEEKNLFLPVMELKFNRRMEFLLANPNNNVSSPLAPEHLHCAHLL